MFVYSVLRVRIRDSLGRARLRGWLRSGAGTRIRARAGAGLIVVVSGFLPDLVIDPVVGPMLLKPLPSVVPKAPVFVGARIGTDPRPARPDLPFSEKRT